MKEKVEFQQRIEKELKEILPCQSNEEEWRTLKEIVIKTAGV